MELEAPARTSIVDVNRTSLRVWEWGDPADPPVLCIHGAQDHGRMWDELAPRVAAWGYRVVALDCRGHGDSGRLFSGHVWHTLGLDLCLLARQLGPPIGVIGHSMGAGQAAYLAGVWPELVRWAVIIDGLGPPDGAFEPTDIAEGADRGFSAVERLVASPARIYASPDEMVERRLKVNHRMPRRWMEHLVAHGARQVEGGWVWKADPLFMVGLPGDFDLEHMHAEHEMVQCPVLALTGSEPDMWSELSPDQKDDRLSHFADVRHEVIKGGGHYLHLEEPEATLDAIGRFLTEVEP